MPNNRTKRSPTDTRGLPPGFDPHMFYEYSAFQNSKTAVGLEGFLYKLIPYQYMASMAFAIDPLANVKISTGKVSPKVRSRTRNLRSVLHESSQVYGSRINGTDASSPIGLGHHTPYYAVFSRLDLSSPRVKIAQGDIFDTSLDTTRRLRVIGSDIGEFEHFKSELFSAPRSYYISNESVLTNQIDPPPWPPQRTRSWSVRARHVGPMAATISPSTVALLKNDAVATATSLINSNVLSMLKSADPSRPDYSLFRNLVELKDLSRSIVSLQQTALDLYKLGQSLNVNKVSKQIHNLRTSLKHIPDEYLSYTFGWRQLYNDVTGLLSTPAKVAKKINYLIKRNGQATTHRSKREFFLPNYVVASGFNYSFGAVDEEASPSTRHRVERKAQLRLAVNSKFEFPPADLPKFENDKFIKLLGVSPTLMDLYNLTPWTWLFDWMTGFGDYLEIILKINSDPQLINWGLITCEVTGDLITDMQSDIIETRSYTYKPPSTNTSVQVTKTRHTHQSILSYKYAIRKDVSSAQPSIKKFWDLSTLSTYQYSVLGALVSQRLKFAR